MKHFFIAQNDYAASGCAFCRALESQGEETAYYSFQHHDFGYPHQRRNEAERSRLWFLGALTWAECIWVIQSDLPPAMGGFPSHKQANTQIAAPEGGWYPLLRGKKVVLLHGGSQYRDNRGYYKALWEPYKPLSLCFEADLCGSFDNEHLVIPPLDASWIPRTKREPGPLRIGHFPSRPRDKGSEWIVPLLRGRGDFRTSVRDHRNLDDVNRVSWPKQTERMRACDVIVDQIKPELNGHRFGEWVSTATETAFLGRIPIANSLDTKPYERTYGRKPGIHVCNDKAALSSEINRLRGLSEKELGKEQNECFQWAIACHSLEPTGRLLMSLL